MRKTRLLAILVIAACAPVPQWPSTPPPPPEARNVPTIRVAGVVVGSDGHRVMFANVLVKACNGGEAGAITNENGEFDVTVEGADCVSVEARSGGASGSAQAPATAAGATLVRLSAPRPLTSAEAERLVKLLAAAINDPANNGGGELAEYILHGPEALRVALEQYRQVLGTVTRATSTSLHGSTGRTLNVDVHQEALTRIHSSLLDYGFRSARFVNAYLRAIASGDAELLARVLNPDDVDFPVPRAREMIAAYRQRYRPAAAIGAEFVDVDDSRATITWRLRGEDPNGNPIAETLTLRHGDGLIGLVLP